mgnify:CR=1 FL=1
MTLCIAWKKNDVINLASDSRATIGGSRQFDHCIKVSKLPIHIKGPLNENDQYEHQPYNGSIGIATAGNFLNASTVKDNLTISLSSLQSIPGITDASMVGICKLIKKYFEFISEKLTNQIFKKGHSKFFVIGHCPIQEKSKAFLFTFDKKSSKVKYKYEEILKSDESINFLGSGKTKAENMFRSIDKTPPLEILRDIIHDDDIESVGGSIQFGKIKYYSFSNYGVIDYVKDDDKKKFASFTHLNGMKMLNSNFMIKKDQFHIQIPYIDPFKKQTDELIEKGYMAKDSL